MAQEISSINFELIFEAFRRLQKKLAYKILTIHGTNTIDNDSMASRLLLLIVVSVGYAIAETEAGSVEPKVENKENLEPDGEAMLAPPDFENAMNAAKSAANCSSFCDTEKLKKDAELIVKNGYKVKLEGKNYGKGLKLRFHPNTPTPSVVEAPPNFSRNREAFRELGKAVRLPNFNSSSSPGAKVKSVSTPSVRNSKLANRIEVPLESNVNNSNVGGHASGAGVQAGYLGASEALLNESPLTQAQKQINNAIDSVPKSFGVGAPLASDLRSAVVGDMINIARDSIYMPRGSSNLTTNPLFGRILSDLNGKNVDGNLK